MKIRRSRPHRVAAAAAAAALIFTITSCTRTVYQPGPPGTPTSGDTSRTPRPQRNGDFKYEALRAPVALPAAEREFRGVWVATVDNIDWPTAPALSTAQQKAELVALLDAAARLHLNAIILQIRPSADALYDSDIEPWSRYLTGETGRAPDPRYDPLAFAVAEAHARGLELHAWFNPFRASLTNKLIADPSHISRARPDLVVTYGTMKWLDPGIAESRQHSLRVIADVAKRYDIDGVHLDDYFYPYVQQDAAGHNIPFPDSATYARYIADGGSMSLGDWRRNNINTFVHDMYDTVHRIKPWVQVGISPFGIWRPGFPEDVKGLDSYAEIYADARTWLRNGWLDYIAPQLYWLTDAKNQPYTSLVRWWTAPEQNAMNREVLFGNAPFNMTRPGWSANEIIRQIDLTRVQRGASGNIFFSAKSFLRAPNPFADMLADTYRTPVLTPAMPWLPRATAVTPRTQVHVDARERLITVDWSRVSPQPRGYLLRTRTRGVWTLYILSGTATTKTVAFGSEAPDLIALSAIGRNGVEGVAAEFVNGE